MVEAGVAIEFVVAVLLAVLLSAWAHGAQSRPGLRLALVLVLAASGAGAAIGGGVYLARHAWSAPEGWAAVAAGLAFLLPLLPPVRALLALVTPMARDSVPDMLGLVILSLVAIFSAYSTLTAGPHLDTQSSPSAAEIVGQSLAEVLVAFFAVGWLLTQGSRATLRRLGLRWPQPREVAIALSLVLVGFAVNVLAGALTHLLQPQLEQQIRTEMKQITFNVSSGWGALVLGTSAGIGEEVLFRGAIQPRYGIVITSVVFALLHTQYGISLTVLGIFGLSLLLGWERRRYGTSSAIVTHGVYDIVAVLLSTLGGGN